MLTITPMSVKNRDRPACFERGFKLTGNAIFALILIQPNRASVRSEEIL
jgi:hypothetical protein